MGEDGLFSAGVPGRARGGGQLEGRRGSEARRGKGGGEEEQDRPSFWAWSAGRLLTCSLHGSVSPSSTACPRSGADDQVSREERGALGSGEAGSVGAPDGDEAAELVTRLALAAAAGRATATAAATAVGRTRASDGPARRRAKGRLRANIVVGGRPRREGGGWQDDEGQGGRGRKRGRRLARRRRTATTSPAKTQLSSLARMDSAWHARLPPKPLSRPCVGRCKGGHDCQRAVRGAARAGSDAVARGRAREERLEDPHLGAFVHPACRLWSAPSPGMQRRGRRSGGRAKEGRGAGDAQRHGADREGLEHRVVEDARLGRQDRRLVAVVARVEAGPRERSGEGGWGSAAGGRVRAARPSQLASKGREEGRREGRGTHYFWVRTMLDSRPLSL